MNHAASAKLQAKKEVTQTLCDALMDGVAMIPQLTEKEALSPVVLAFVDRPQTQCVHG